MIFGLIESLLIENYFQYFNNRYPIPFDTIENIPTFDPSSIRIIILSNNIILQKEFFVQFAECSSRMILEQNVSRRNSFPIRNNARAIIKLIKTK